MEVYYIISLPSYKAEQWIKENFFNHRFIGKNKYLFYKSLNTGVDFKTLYYEYNTDLTLKAEMEYCIQREFKIALRRRIPIVLTDWNLNVEDRMIYEVTDNIWNKHAIVLNVDNDLREWLIDARNSQYNFLRTDDLINLKDKFELPHADEKFYSIRKIDLN